MPVAQLDRASVCGTEGRTFESYRAHQKLSPLWGCFYFIYLFTQAQEVNTQLLVYLPFGLSKISLWISVRLTRLLLVKYEYMTMDKTTFQLAENSCDRVPNITWMLLSGLGDMPSITELGIEPNIS